MRFIDGYKKKVMKINQELYEELKDESLTDEQRRQKVNIYEISEQMINLIDLATNSRYKENGTTNSDSPSIGMAKG